MSDTPTLVNPVAAALVEQVPAVTPSAMLTPAAPAAKPAPTPATPKQPLVTEALTILDNLAEKWLEFSGKINHNPHLRIGELIVPLKAKLTAALATSPKAVISPDTQATIVALPKTPPVIDPNYVAPVAPKISAPQPR